MSYPSYTFGMGKVLAMNLTDMRVMGDDGTEIGELKNITCDLETGNLGDLIIDPTQKASEMYDTHNDGYVHIPTRRLTAVKDYIVIKQN